MSVQVQEQCQGCSRRCSAVNLKYKTRVILSSHILFIDSCVYFNSKNLDLFGQLASSTIDTDTILSSCLAFSQGWNPKPLTKVSEHTKTLPSVITRLE